MQDRNTVSAEPKDYEINCTNVSYTLDRTMKTSELVGPELDYWVAKAQGWLEKTHGWLDNELRFHNKHFWEPSTNWKQVGELVEKYHVSFSAQTTGNYMAWIKPGDNNIISETPQVSICRAVVASVYGENVGEEDES